jgi:hypothetical protein
VRGQKALARSETDPVGTVALGRAQSQFQTVFFLINQIASTLCNSDSLPSLVPKIFKLCKGLDLNVMNNFFSLAKLPIPTVSHDINFGNQIQFKSFMNFKRVPTFLKKI